RLDDRLQRRLLRRLRTEALERAAERVGERAADEEEVGDSRQRAAAHERVVELDVDARGVVRDRLEADALGRAHPVLEYLRDQAGARLGRDDALGHDPAAGRSRAPDELR